MRYDTRQLKHKIDMLEQNLKRTLKCNLEDLPPRLKKSIWAGVIEITDQVRKVAQNLVPIRQPAVVFDPLNPVSVSKFATVVLLAQLRHPLADIPSLCGSGVYAIYYKGKSKLYRPISGIEHPIYVGKADPEKLTANTSLEQGDYLTSRLNEHSRDIQKAQDDHAKTLLLDDFECRFLVMKSGWASAAESYLIDLYQPIWNYQSGICSGFDDTENLSTLRSPWDALHPGRDWAHHNSRMKNALSPETIRNGIEVHFEQNPPLKTIDKVFKRFIDELRQT